MSNSIDCSKILPKDQWDNSKEQVILLAVGSFSPITFMHLRLFEMARDHLADHDIQVIGGFVSPVNDAYKKPGLIPASHRIEMCKLALKDHDWVQVDCWEAEQKDWQTTVQVLTSLQDRLTGFEGFPDLWAVEDQEKIVRDHGLVVIERTGTDLSEYLLINSVLFTYRKNIHLVKQVISNDVSSTKVRLLVSRGLSVRYILPDPVIAYIKASNLYKN